MYPESYWNYRVVQFEDGEEVYHQIHEVYYKYDDISMWSEEAVPVGGETVEELRRDLQMQMDALDKPVLLAKDLPGYAGAEEVKHKVV